MAFSWKQKIAELPAKKLARYTNLARVNPDFQVKHPELTRELLNPDTKKKVETIKYIQHEVDKKVKYGIVPKPSLIPKRFNRIA